MLNLPPETLMTPPKFKILEDTLGSSLAHCAVK